MLILLTQTLLYKGCSLNINSSATLPVFLAGFAVVFADAAVDELEQSPLIYSGHTVDGRHPVGSDSPSRLTPA